MNDVICIALAATCWALWAVIEKVAVRSMSPMLVQLTNVYVYSAVAPLAFLAMKWRNDPMVWTKPGIAWAVAAACLAVIANYSFLFAIESRPVYSVMSYTQLYPIATYLMCWTFLGESMTTQKLVGSIMMIAGCALMNR